MIGYADVEKRSMRAPGPAVLSLCLPVPPEPPDRAAVRGLAAQAEDLRASAGAGGPDGTSIAKAGHLDRDAVPGALAAHGRDWLGHIVAFRLPAACPGRCAAAAVRSAGTCRLGGTAACPAAARGNPAMPGLPGRHRQPSARGGRS